MYQPKNKLKKTSKAVLILDKTDFKTNSITVNKQGHDSDVIKFNSQGKKF